MSDRERQSVTPCKCGHELHRGQACESCACAVSCPDYAEAARRVGREPTSAEIDATADMVIQVRWRDPGGETVTERVCAYCLGTFLATRGHRRTCSPACRVARHRALKLAADADVPSPVVRRDCFAEDRRRATGYGLMTATEMWRADLRVRSEAAAK
jgi:hypothetical protein